MYTELEINSNSESFIRGWYIPTDICDALREDFISKIKRTKFDDVREYNAFTAESLDKKINQDYLDALQKCVNEYKKVYSWCNIDKNWGIQTRYNIQKYEPGNCYRKWHVEETGPTTRSGKNIRHLVFATYLNTIEEGGETAYQYQNVDVKPIKGLTVIWPAGWTHPHRGNPAPTETKYIATGWCTFKHKY